MRLNEWFDKLDVNVALKKISENTTGALLLLFVGLFLIVLTCNRADVDDCSKKLQSLNDSLIFYRKAEAELYRNLYFQKIENKNLNSIINDHDSALREKTQNKVDKILNYEK